MLKNLKLIKRTQPTVPTISKLENEMGGNSWVISIRGCIEAPDYFAIACDVLNSATDKDTVLIVINTPGGRVDSGTALISAIQNCKAVVTTRAVGMVASCGAFIWSYGHKLEVCDFSRIMFHQSSGGMMGKMRTLRDYSLAAESAMMELVQKAVERKIISQEQLATMFESKQDVYLNIKDLEKAGVEFSHA